MMDTHLLLRAFVDELARCGMRHACTSPGSRSSPLVLALVAEERLRLWSHIDERCAGFFALGLAKATGLPAAVSVTSGTAAANLSPAVHEAHEARVPLLLLTADRPPELRQVGAGQTIDQIKLYGGAAKWFFEVGDHPASPARVRWMRALACRAYWTALEGRPGAVHLNFPLREPLVPAGPLPEEPGWEGTPRAETGAEGSPPPEAGRGGRAGGRPWVTRPRAVARPSEEVVEQLAAEVEQRPRGVVVAGREERHRELPAALARFAAAAGLPLLADPLSGARSGPSAVAHYDLLLRSERFAAAHAPELVVRVGDLPTSKALRGWLAGATGAVQLALDPEGAWQDPDAVLSTLLAADPAATLDAVAARLEIARSGPRNAPGARPRAPGRPAGHSGWLADWHAADRTAAERIAATLGDDLSEPRVAAELGVRLPAYATLFVASSMPVRDVEAFFPVRDAHPRVLAHRGANGIDGTVSAAFGAAGAGGGPVVLLIGDVALVHDMGGLLAASRLGLSLTIVLLDNDGGGIFHFLPIADRRDAFEEHVATPHGLDFARVASAFDLVHRPVSDPPAFRAALDESIESTGVTLIEVRTDREVNRELHRRVADAVVEAVGG